MVIGSLYESRHHWSKGLYWEELISVHPGKGMVVEGFSSSDPGNIDPKSGVLSNEFRIPDGTQAVVYLAQSPYYHQVPEMFPHIVNVNLASTVKIADLLGGRSGTFHLCFDGERLFTQLRPLAEDAPICRNHWYLLSKIYAEEALSLFKDDISIMVLRFFGVYGPGQTNKLVPNLLDSILEDREIYIERNPHNPYDQDGLKISLCYIEDALKILYKLIIQGGPNASTLPGIKRRAFERYHRSWKICPEGLSFCYFREIRFCDLIADVSLLKKTLNQILQIWKKAFV